MEPSEYDERASLEQRVLALEKMLGGLIARLRRISPSVHEELLNDLSAQGPNEDLQQAIEAGIAVEDRQRRLDDRRREREPDPEGPA